MTLTMIAGGLFIMGVVLYLAMLPILMDRQAARQAQLAYNAQYTEQDIHARYELLLHSIVDLDHDYDMGKVSDNVYIEQRKMLIGRSVYVRKQLDALEEDLLTIDNEALEAMIEAHRDKHMAKQNADIEAQIAAYREEAAS